MIIEIPGKPIGKKRPVFTTLFGRCKNCGKITLMKYGACRQCSGSLFPMPRAHKDPEEASKETRWLDSAKEQITDCLEGPVIFIGEFLVPITSGMSKKLVRQIEAGETVWYEKGKDADNYIKFAMDVLNGITWRDDSQVVFVIGFKRYGSRPSTVLQIERADSVNIGGLLNQLITRFSQTRATPASAQAQSEHLLFRKDWPV